MSQLTLDLPAALVDSLSRRAANQGRSVAQLAIEQLARSFGGELEAPRTDAAPVAEAPMDRETEAWLDGGFLPYDWGNADPLTLGAPVRYVLAGGQLVERAEQSGVPNP
mgnify:CR=1 FL=1